MGILDLFRTGDPIIKDKIILTQKNRITALERDVQDLKEMINGREGELREVRTNFDRSKERMVDQIVELSDKFAGIQQDIMTVAHENGKLKGALEYKGPASSVKKSSKKKKEKSKK